MWGQMTNTVFESLRSLRNRSELVLFAKNFTLRIYFVPEICYNSLVQFQTGASHEKL
jgi:hypothetical protein